MAWAADMQATQRFAQETQVVLIDPSGDVVYQGAIDSICSANEADILKAVNYMRQAITEVSGGRPVSIASSVPYGCSVKY